MNAKQPDTRPSGEKTDIVAKVRDTAVGILTRVLVHVGSLIAGVILSFAATPPGASFGLRASMFFCSYVGLVCMIPRDMGNRPDWAVPALSGVALCVVWTVFGLPAPVTPVMGGALAWTVRLLIRRKDMGSKWAAFPALLAGAYLFFTELLPMAGTQPRLWIFPVIALLGYKGYGYLTRNDFEPPLRARLQAAGARLEALAASRMLPDPLPEQASLLAGRVRGFTEGTPRLPRSAETLAADLETALGSLDTVARGGASGMWTEQARDAFEEMGVLNTALARRPGTQSPAPDSARSHAEQRLAAFNLRTDELIRKKHLVPREIQGHVDNIYASARQIMQCMREDPQDMLPGDKFLTRYLKATHTVVDEYARLAGQKGASVQDAGDTLACSRELLGRLEKAFRDEYDTLQRNNAVDLMAELNVLDKLLKMDGK